MATAAVIREQLLAAGRYGQDKDRAAADPDVDEPEYDAKCEALLPVLRGSCRCISTRIAWTTSSPPCGWQRNFICGSPSYTGPRGIARPISWRLRGAGALRAVALRPEQAGTPRPDPREPGAFVPGGVELAVINDHPVIPQQYLALCAGLAVREGLPYEAALEAVTLGPARICGIDDRVGSITPGKDADLVLFPGDPLTMAAKAVGGVRRGDAGGLITKMRMN